MRVVNIWFVSAQGRQLESFILRPQPPTKHELLVMCDLRLRADQSCMHPAKGRHAQHQAWAVALALSRAEPWPEQHFHLQGRVRGGKPELQQIPKDFGIPLARCLFHVKSNAV